ncbi:MAG: hypothetical protein GX447_07695 [Elusimicrobia bacterium]|nr:hypothetical protein [Elusimicrobiota bacterium]
MKTKIFIFLFLSATFALSYAFVYKYPPLSLYKQNSVMPMTEMISLSFGLRKAGAGILFINLLQYYGTPEIPEHAEIIEHEDGHGHKHIHYEGEPEFGAGEYPLFYEYSKKILFLDPYFVNAALYSCGALAFNLNRPDQAIALIKTVLSYSKNQDYYKMLAAIAAKNAGTRKELAEIMYEIALKEDTPVILKNSAAFINKKIGRNDRARDIYKIILKTTKDEFYIKIAEKNLQLI